MPRSISARTVSRQPQLIELLQLRSSRPLGPLLCDGATRMTGLWSGEALFVSARCRLCHSRLRRGLSAGLCSRATRPRPRTTCAAQEPLRQLENRDLVVGDVAALWAFSCWKQIAGIVTDPSFPGWLAPLHANPQRIAEFICFSGSSILTWFFASLLLGGYRLDATSTLPTTVKRVTAIWVVQQPVALSQWVLEVAAVNGRWVNDLAGPLALPYALRAPLEPFTGAIGVLGLMVAWRSFYSVYYDWWNDKGPDDVEQARRAFLEALGVCGALAVTFESALLFAAHAMTTTP